MKYTVIRDLVFYNPSKEDPYATNMLAKGTEGVALTRREVGRLDYSDQKALKRMKKRNSNLLAFVWDGHVRTAIKDKDVILTKIKSRGTFLQGLIDGKD